MSNREKQSKKSLRFDSRQSRFLWTSLGALFLCAGLLFWLQHSGRLSGGAIAPAKLGWLVTALVYWFLLPIYWLMDDALPRIVRICCTLFLASMLLRGIVELYMMYIGRNWLHIYGIAHDLLSIIICLLFALRLTQSNKLLALYFFYCSILFAIETLFAHYLKQVSDGDGTVFFLESAPAHSSILWITGVAVLISCVVFVYLIKSRESAATAS